MALTIAPPVDERRDSDGIPQQRAGEIDPDSILHTLDIDVALKVLLDTHRAKDVE